MNGDESESIPMNLLTDKMQSMWSWKARPNRENTIILAEISGFWREKTSFGFVDFNVLTIYI